MNPIHKKLKTKPGQQILLMNAPAAIYNLLEPLPDDCSATEEANGKADAVMLFVHNSDELQMLYKKAVAHTAHEGLLWFCYPKGSSKIQTDLTRDAGWECVMMLNYQWISLISLDDTWSAFAVRVGKIAPPPQIGKPKENIMDLDGTVLVDYDKRIVMAPKRLKELLKNDKESLAYFDKLSFSHKKEYVLYVFEAKKEETRMARLEKAALLLAERRKTPAGKG